MKRILMLSAAAMMACCTFAQSIQGDVNNDGVVTTADVPALSSMILGKTTTTAAADVNGDGHVAVGDIASLVYILLPPAHEWVDLGLPSKTLWATCNVGADNPEDFGDYFAWGETVPAGGEKTTYSWGTYKWMQSGKAAWQYINKYQTPDNWKGIWFDSSGDFCGDGMTTLETADDAATANWGEDWQMPNNTQCEELINSEYTTSEWTKVNNIAGRKITSLVNGNSIFLPAAGEYSPHLGYVGGTGYYWTRTLYDAKTPDAYYLCLYGLGIYTDGNSRYAGCSVRPVRTVIAVNTITLSETCAVVEAGESLTLTCTVLPQKASNRNVNWTSSDESIATVSASGVVTGVAKGEVTITATAADGNGATATCRIAVMVPNDDTKEYVDLGLPSGTCWATCNIGAKTPEAYGDYIAWGETVGYIGGKTMFNWATYKWMKENKEDNRFFTKYQIADGTTIGIWYDSDGNFIGDGLTELEPIDDAATMNWGPDWQMPSCEQMKEIINEDYTTISLTTLNNVAGRLITSKINGNTIFLPIAGYRSYEDLRSEAEYSFYGGRDLYTTSMSNRLFVNAYDSVRCIYGGRVTGASVRPVRKQ